ncbi:MAG: fructosamine kinase family protein [Anaerolineales bacterium]|jgi:protein-ribulosamine 3-kinase
MMNVRIPKAVHDWLQENGFGEIEKLRPVSGGCINNGMILQTGSGQSVFLKTNPGAPENMFEREAEGLVALATQDGPRVPKPFCFGKDFLLMEDLSPGPRRPGYWTDFGRQLAHLHNCTNTRFGFTHDNYIGSTPQPNPWTADGHVFFAEQRLIFQAKLARQQGLLDRLQVDQVERLAARLPELIPVQPAALIHGDLWSGNVTADRAGNPALIDPAVHYGWAEAELGMTDLFGSFPQEFYAAYQEVRPLAGGFRERFPLYNLYHLLNHLNLFGTGYSGQVSAILSRYV